MITRNSKTAAQVVFCLPNGFDLGGVTNWSIQIARALEKSGKIHASLIEHPMINNEKVEVLRNSFHCITADVKKGAFQIKPKNLAAYESSLPATVVPNWSGGTYATWARIATKQAAEQRIIGMCHTYEPEYFKILTYYESIIHRFVAVSEECEKHLKSILPHRCPDILLRAYPVDQNMGLDKKYSLTSDPIRLTYAGRIQSKQKRIFDLLDLAGELKKRSIPFVLNIVGEGTEKSLLIEKILALDSVLQDSIRVSDAVCSKDMPTVFQSTDVCVLVSAFEGQSIVMLEAMANKCIPVVTEVSGTGIIVNGLNGFKTAVGDTKAMADNIETLAKSRTLLPLMGMNAQNTVRGNSLEAYLSWFLELNMTIWNEQPRAWPNGKNPFMRGLFRYTDYLFQKTVDKKRSGTSPSAVRIFQECQLSLKLRELFR